jgi:hypothetical protein
VTEAQRLLDQVRHQLDEMVENRLLSGWTLAEQQRYSRLAAVEASLLLNSL